MHFINDDLLPGLYLRSDTDLGPTLSELFEMNPDEFEIEVVPSSQACIEED